MLHSMTGFARESVETDIGTLAWEIRAVNHRYLDVQFKLPEDLRPNEAAFRQQASKVLGRGKVDCALYFRRAFDQQSEMQIDSDLVTLLGARLAQVSAKLPNAAAVNPVEILRWPGVVQQSEIDAEPLFNAATLLLSATLDSIAAMRASEGQRIAEMLESRSAEIDAITGAVRKRMPDVLEASRAKQKERIEKLDVEADPARLEVELALRQGRLCVVFSPRLRPAVRDADRLGSCYVARRSTRASQREITQRRGR